GPVRTLEILHTVVAMDVEADDVEMLLGIAPDVLLAEVVFQQCLAVGAVFLAIVQDQAPLARVGGLLEILPEVEETELEPVGMAEGLAERQVVEAQLAILRG